MKKASFQTNFKPLFGTCTYTYFISRSLYFHADSSSATIFNYYSEFLDFEQNVKCGFYIKLASETDRYGLSTCCSS